MSLQQYNLDTRIHPDRCVGATDGGVSSVLACIVNAWRRENYDLDHVGGIGYCSLMIFPFDGTPFRLRMNTR
jgi:hypothetical protein